MAITLGDPAGIGPEVTELALHMLLAARPQLKLSLFGPENVAAPLAARVRAQHGRTEIIVHGQAFFTGPLAQPTAASGRAALDALNGAIKLAQAGGVDALVTAPLSKQALFLAGSNELGHTEILARTLGSGPVAMAFFTEKLQVVLATVHIPLRDVFTALTCTRVYEVATLLHHALHKQLGKAPRLALAGLNPHAGEGGLFGDEEARILLPAVTLARAAGIHLSAPVAPDTVFNRAVAGEFDGVVALYHDQGLIPVKLLSFGEAVNVTLGLRVLRTSPDHGTAYDRVNTGTARPHGMLGALRAALMLTADQAATNKE